MSSDEDLARAFLESMTWKRHIRFEPYRHKRGIRGLVRSFLRTRYGIPWEQKETPEEIELLTGRVTFLVHSAWGKKAAETAKKGRLALRVRKIERAEKKRRAERRAVREPTFI